MVEIRKEGSTPPVGKPWLVVVVSLIVSLLIGEAILRLAWTNPYETENTDHLIRLRLAHTHRRFPVDRRILGSEEPLGWYRTDERGYILPSFQFEDPDATILFLGGSTTQCRAVLEDLRFHALVSQALGERGLRINALNAGLAGGTVQDSMNILLNHSVDDEPDVAVMMHAANDIARLWADGSYVYRMGQPASAGTAARWALQRLSISTSFFGAVRWWLTAAPLELDEFERRAALSREDAEIDATPFVQRLRGFVGMARGFGIVPVLMTQPAISVRPADSPAWINPKNQERFNELIRMVAAEEDVTLIDLERHLVEDVPDWDQPMRIFYDGIHINDEGSRVYGAYIAQRLWEDVFQPGLTGRRPMQMKNPPSRLP